MKKPILRAKEVMSFALALLMGILTSFAVWSVVWTLEARDERTFGFGAQSTVFSIRGATQKEYVPQFYTELNTLLLSHNTALLYDGNGDGLPGIMVLDPGHVLSWWDASSSDSSQSNITKVYLFTGTYCAQTYSQKGTCVLMPANSKIAGLIEAPKGAAYYQYAAIPSKSMAINSGRIVVNTADKNSVAAILNIFTKYNFDVQTTHTSTLMIELIQNPLVLISFGLLSFGLFFNVLYWKIRHVRMQSEIFIRKAVGATNAKIIWASIGPIAIMSTLGCTVSACLSTPLIQFISGIEHNNSMTLPLLCGAVVCSVLLILIYAATMMSTMRHVTRSM